MMHTAEVSDRKRIHFPCNDPGHHGWSSSDILDESNRILSSPLFVRSTRLSRFLQTAVQYLLEGKTGLLKEYTIGVEVYNRRSSFDPSQDSIVRTEARRLRYKLQVYYAQPASRRSLMIHFAAGSYVPVIRTYDAVAGPEVLPQVRSLPEGRPCNQLGLAIIPFRVSRPDSLCQHLAGELEDELGHQLSHVPGLRVFRASPAFFDREQLSSPAWQNAAMRLLIHGCVRQSGEARSILAQITTLSGLILWSHLFEWTSMPNQHQAFGATLVAGLGELLIRERALLTSTRIMPGPRTFEQSTNGSLSEAV